MSESEQLIAFAADLDRLVDRYRDEFDLTYSSMTSCLMFKVFTLFSEAKKRYEDGEIGDDLTG